MINSRHWMLPAALSLAAVVGAGCSSGHSTAGGTTTTTDAAASTTISSSNTTAASPTTATARPNFATIQGSYVAGTEDGGSLYIRSDGASRFLAPDSKSCPSCTTADSPIASIDFALETLTSHGGGAYTATGAITDTSDAPWAAQLRSNPAVGSAVTVDLPANGTASISFLPTNDPLKYTSKTAAYTNTPPCTVAAATGPVQASQSGATVAGVNCAVDEEWMEASVSDNGIDEVVILQASYTAWIVVDRPTVCNSHDVPSNFYTTACSTS